MKKGGEVLFVKALQKGYNPHTVTNRQEIGTNFPAPAIFLAAVSDELEKRPRILGQVMNLGDAAGCLHEGCFSYISIAHIDQENQPKLARFSLNETSRILTCLIPPVTEAPVAFGFFICGQPHKPGLLFAAVREITYHDGQPFREPLTTTKESGESNTSLEEALLPLSNIKLGEIGANWAGKLGLFDERRFKKGVTTGVFLKTVEICQDGQEPFPHIEPLQVESGKSKEFEVIIYSGQNTEDGKIRCEDLQGIFKIKVVGQTAFFLKQTSRIINLWKKVVS